MYKKNLKFLRYFLFATFLGRLFLIPFRFFSASKEGLKIWKKIFLYTFFSKEFDNYTYDLTSLNKKHLSNFIACITGVSHRKVTMYFNEIENDKALRLHLNNYVNNTSLKFSADRNMFYGRRIGWYALIRIIKPRLVVETGVDKGLGACVITAALMKNAQEGKKGQYIGLDINPMSGKLFFLPYTKYGELVCIDSHRFLKKMKESVDIFIHDSDHSMAHESKEYELIKNKLSKKSYILSDNAHLSDALNFFAAKIGKRFLFFKEEPKNHWYKGAGIGVVW